MDESVRNLVRCRVLSLRKQLNGIEEAIDHYEVHLEALKNQRTEIANEFKDLEKVLEEST